MPLLNQNYLSHIRFLCFSDIAPSFFLFFSQNPFRYHKLLFETFVFLSILYIFPILYPNRKHYSFFSIIIHALFLVYIKHLRKRSFYFNNFLFINIPILFLISFCILFLFPDIKYSLSPVF